MQSSLLTVVSVKMSYTLYKYYDMYRPLLTGSKLCKINLVDMTGCAADAQTCDLVRGRTINMTMNFTTGLYLPW